MTRLTSDALADIQGFITSGYGHLPFATYCLLQARDATSAQRWLVDLIPMITTAAPWPTTSHGEKIKPLSAINVAFTAQGLSVLGLPRSVRCTFPIEFQDGIATADRSAILGDTDESAPGTWEFGGPSQPAIHAVLIVHGATQPELEGACRAQRELMAAAGGVTELGDVVQTGHRPAGGDEPFGFHDGLAQPSIGGLTGNGAPTGEFILGYPNHYEVIPPAPVVREDELDGSSLLPPLANPYHEGRGLRDLGVNGSYVVYRKLRQDVAAFWQFMKHEAIRATGRDDAGYMVWLASRFVGRWPSGAPLALASEHDDPRLSDRNDFLYADDAGGFACPIGAHVRRTNPRDVLKPYGIRESLNMSEAHRLLRRARVFGPPLFDAQVLRDPTDATNAKILVNVADDGKPRGIHFFCVNASIKSQFEFVQQTWCNNPRFGGLNDNKDPITGDNAQSDAPSSHMSIPREPLGFRTAALPRFVTVRGGAYLFMPSMTALRFLGAFRPYSRNPTQANAGVEAVEQSRSRDA